MAVVCWAMGRKNKGLSKDKNRYVRKKVYTEAGISIPGLWKGINKYYVQVSVVKDNKIVKRFQTLKALTLEDAIKESQEIKIHWAKKRLEFQGVKFEKTNKELKELADIVKNIRPLPERYYHCFSIRGDMSPKSVEIYNLKKIIRLKEDVVFFNSILRDIPNIVLKFVTSLDLKDYITIQNAIFRIVIWARTITKFFSAITSKRNRLIFPAIGFLCDYLVCVNTKNISEEEIKIAHQAFETVLPLSDKIQEIRNEHLSSLKIKMSDEELLTYSQNFRLNK